MSTTLRFVTAITLITFALTGCKRRTGPRTTPQSTAASTTDSRTTDESEALDRTDSPPAEDRTEAEADPRARAIEEAYESLVRGDDTSVRRTIELGGDMETVLKRVVASENIKACVRLCDVAKALPRDVSLTPHLASLLSHTAAVVRVAALDAIGARVNSGLLDPVLATLRDAELDVRASACDAIGALGRSNRRTLGAMVPLIADEEDAVRAACAYAFSTLADRKVWQTRLSVTLDGGDLPAREGALRVLSYWTDEVSFDLIRGRLGDKSGSVVAAALASLASFGDLATLREVERFLKDERVAVRVEAVVALENLPLAKTRGHVFQALEDRVAIIRLEAASQLSRFKQDQDALIRLHALFRDEDVGVRDAAAIAAAELGDPSSFTSIREHLGTEKEDQVAASLVEALVASDPKRAIPHLIDQLADERPQVRTKVIIELRTRTGQDLPIDAAKWKEWYASAKDTEK